MMGSYRKITCALAILALCSSNGCKNKETVQTTEKETPAKEVRKETPQTSSTRTIEVVQDEAFNMNSETDRFTINSMNQKGDSIYLNVSYGGGCETHEFKLIHTGAYLESVPPQLDAFLWHNANDDRCRAYITETLRFDAGGLAYEGMDELVLRVKGTENFTIQY